MLGRKGILYLHFASAVLGTGTYSKNGQLTAAFLIDWFKHGPQLNLVRHDPDADLRPLEEDLCPAGPPPSLLWQSGQEFSAGQAWRIRHQGLVDTGSRSVTAVRGAAAPVTAALAAAATADHCWTLSPWLWFIIVCTFFPFVYRIYLRIRIIFVPFLW